MTLREEMEKASDQLQVDAEFGIKSIENFIDTETAIEIAERHLKSETAKAVGHDLRVSEKFAEVKQEIIKHFNSEKTILDNIKDEIDDKEYEYRKAEIERQKFYITLIVSKFSA